MTFNWRVLEILRIMNGSSRMDFVKLVLLAGCLVSIRAQFKFCDLKIAFRSKTITAKSMWEHSGVRSKLACAVACLKDVRCKTFIYSRSQKTCVGYRGNLDNYKYLLTDFVGGGNFVIKIHECRGTTTHGKLCSRDEECNIQESVCYKGVCLCRPGLYFSPKHNICLKKCAEYGDGMDVYKGAGITGYNDKIIKHTPLRRCLELCVHEKAFTCLTVDWGQLDSECILSRYGYLDVREEVRDHDEVEWSFGQRRCK